ncbi:galactose-1-phosphate uridylyltransferase [Candidatus Bathyarchaeota archaeon]|nr:galactose-1-phosphate uridylyltransferase [Candidatus Bathyarchaeota archaeon]
MKFSKTQITYTGKAEECTMTGDTRSYNERRWNPFLKKWIMIAPKRENRPLDVKGTSQADIGQNGKIQDQLKKSATKEKKFCPFCVGAPEVPEPYDVVMLGNKFPALSLDNKDVASKLDPGSPYKVAPAIGQQNVVLYTPDHGAKFRDLPVNHICKLVKLWKEKYMEIGNIPEIAYVFEFENRGELIGVSLAHPHGQIYSFSWIPTYIKTELDAFKEYMEHTNRCLLCDIVKEEMEQEVRIIQQNTSFISCVPFFASWPHEVHIYSRKHLLSFEDFDDKIIHDFASILKDLNARYDALYPGMDMSFVMAIHQAPTDGKDYSYYHFHVEFYPPLRKVDVRKFAAGVELGTGTWINSSLPETFAQKMRAVLD